jgi:hypothetical protein
MTQDLVMSFARRATHTSGSSPMHTPSNIAIPPPNMRHYRLATPAGSRNNMTNEHETSKSAASGTPLLAQRLQTLSKASGPRPAEAAHVKVIAVDGLERPPVEELLSLLEKNQRLNPNSNVRVYAGLPIRGSHPTIQPIHHWDALWKQFSEETLDRKQIHIIIVGFAPLMAMQKVSALYPWHDIYAEQANWDRLAHEWQGRIQPDITIIVQQYDRFLQNPTVLPVHETQTLMVPQVSERGPFWFSRLQLELLQTFVRCWLDEGS